MTSVWLVIADEPHSHPGAFGIEGVFSSEAGAAAFVRSWMNEGKYPDGSPCHQILELTIDEPGL